MGFFGRITGTRRKSYDILLDSPSYEEPFRCTVFIPDNVSVSDIRDALKDGCTDLLKEDEDIGPVDLLRNVCKKNGWNFEAWDTPGVFLFDLEIEDIKDLVEEERA